LSVQKVDNAQTRGISQSLEQGRQLLQRKQHTPFVA
jgi:hypothetical protein